MFSETLGAKVPEASLELGCLGLRAQHVFWIEALKGFRAQVLGFRMDMRVERV